MASSDTLHYSQLTHITCLESDKEMWDTSAKKNARSALILIQIFIYTFAPEGRIYATVSPIPQTAEKVKTLHMDCE